MKYLVAYFSATGKTKSVAENLSKAIDADIFEIKPKHPYTAKDLNWMDSNSRSTIESKDRNSRPEIENKLSNIDDYHTIFLGFPIWWYTAPRIINSFLESYDMKNKTIILFATSGGSGLNNTKNDLQISCDKSTTIISGKVLNSHQDADSLKQWVNSLKL